MTYVPGGFIGNHHHAGPGLRCVTSGTLTYTQEGKTSDFGPGSGSLCLDRKTLVAEIEAASERVWIEALIAPSGALKTTGDSASPRSL